MRKLPFRTKLRNVFAKQVVVSRRTTTASEDEYGQQETLTTEDFTVLAEIQELTSRDLLFLPPGTVSPGDAWGYFFPTYQVKGRTITIQPEDRVSWNSKTWRVDTIQDFSYGEDVFYSKILLRRVL